MNFVLDFYFSNTTDGDLSDLWKYNGANWVWKAGSNLTDRFPRYGNMSIPAARNTPGGRSGSASWIDSNGFLWLYGGSSQDGLQIPYNLPIGYFADLWKFNGVNWTWMYGSKNYDELADFGELGIAAANNTPGARDSSSSWKDSKGNFWLFGGTTITETDISNTILDIFSF